MQHYTLQFEGGDPDEPDSIEFDSEDGHEAFGILSRTKVARKAKIYEGDNLLGTIVKTAQDGWLLNP